jgi:hypothetical protein
MKMRHLLLLGWIGLFVGCHPRAMQQDVNQHEGSAAMKEKSASSSPNAGGKETNMGARTIRGKLYHTKGRMGEVAGFILPPHFLTDGGSNWKPAYEALVGQEVEVQGVHFQYRCGPIEQCLEGGVINYLREIVYLKKAE